MSLYGASLGVRWGAGSGMRLMPCADAESADIVNRPTEHGAVEHDALKFPLEVGLTDNSSARSCLT